MVAPSLYGGTGPGCMHNTPIDLSAIEVMSVSKMYLLFDSERAPQPNNRSVTSIRKPVTRSVVIVSSHLVALPRWLDAKVSKEREFCRGRSRKSQGCEDSQRRQGLSASRTLRCLTQLDWTTAAKTAPVPILWLKVLSRSGNS